MKLASRVPDYLKRWAHTEVFRNWVGPIDPVLYLEHLAAKETDDEVRHYLRKLADTKLMRGAQRRCMIAARCRHGV